MQNSNRTVSLSPETDEGRYRGVINRAWALKEKYGSASNALFHMAREGPVFDEGTAALEKERGEQSACA